MGTMTRSVVHESNVPKCILTKVVLYFQFVVAGRSEFLFVPQSVHHNHHPVPFHIDSTCSAWQIVFRDFVAIFIWYRPFSGARPFDPALLFEGLSARVIG